jgi:type IV secretion system protein VirD4
MAFWKMFGQQTPRSEPDPLPPPDQPPEPLSSTPRAEDVSIIAARDQERGGWRVRRPSGSATYGDARFASLSRDAAIMKEALGGGAKGIWYGTMANVGAPSREPREVSYTGERHLLTIAPNGSGKGSCAIIPNLIMQKDISILCIDPKGQNAAVTKRRRRKFSKVFFLNPFNEHGLGTARFNPLASLKIDSPNVVGDAGSLAEALIIKEGNEPFFTDSARDLVKAIMLHLVATKGNSATLPDMRKLLTLPRGTGDADKFGLLIFDMMESPYPFISQPAGRFKNIDRTTQSIISVAISQTSFLDDPAIARVLSGDDFRMLDFKKEVTTLYVILPSRYIAAYSRFLRLIVVSAIDQLSSVPGGIRTLLMLDEFAQLGYLSSIENAIGLMRGYKVQLWPFLQDLNQLKSIYKDRWETFIANAGMVQWFTPNDHFTAEYLSKRIGKTTVRTRSGGSSSGYNSGGGSGMSFNPGGGVSSNRTQGNSESSSDNWGEAATDFMSPQDLMDLPDYFQIVTHAGLKYPIIATREHYYEWSGDMKILRDDCDPDPFHS